MGNPAEVRRHVTSDTKAGAEVLARLDRVQGCFERVKYVEGEPFGAVTLNDRKAPAAVAAREKFGGSFTFGAKDPYAHVTLDVVANTQFTARLEKEASAAGAALKSALARSGAAALGGAGAAGAEGADRGGVPATPPRRPGAGSPPRAHASAYDQAHDERTCKEVYDLVRLGKADHERALGSFSTTNTRAAEDVAGAALETPAGAHFNACGEFLRALSGSPNGLSRTTLLHRDVV